MGRPDPQPKSITVAPGGSVRAQSRTALAPMAVEGARPRPARNSTATPSYPLDRSVIERTLSVAKGLTLALSGNTKRCPLEGVVRRPPTAHLSPCLVAWSAVDDGHVPFVVALAGGRREVVQPFDMLDAQLHAVGGCVLLDAGDALGAGDRGDVVALREQPGQSDLRRCGIDLGGNCLDLVDDAEVLLEVALGEARIGLAPVVVAQLLRGANRPGEKAVPERRVGQEADA